MLSTSLNNIIQAGQRDIEAKIDDIPAVEWRGGELVIPSVHQEIEEPWGRTESTVLDKEKLDKIVRLIRYYEVKEATTMFELALWKAKIDQVRTISTEMHADLKYPDLLKRLFYNTLDEWTINIVYTIE